MKANNYEDLAPLSSSIDVISTPNAVFYFTLSLQSRSFWFNMDTVKKFDVIAGDRVGFLFSKSDPSSLKVYIYFSSNVLGTIPIKKYKNSAYRVNNYNAIVALSKPFRLTTGTNLRLYINENISIRVPINGKEETCYLVTTKVDERTDIDDFIKEFITIKYKELFTELLNK